MERFVHVGMLCAHLIVALRPTIVEALKMLIIIIIIIIYIIINK